MVVRSLVALACLASLVAGCFGAPFESTPCKPVVSSQSSLEVQLVWRAEGDPVPYDGTCVGVYQPNVEEPVSTARIDASGHAVLPMPVSGQVFVKWMVRDPKDDLCGYEGYASMTWPGPANVTLDVGKICA